MKEIVVLCNHSKTKDIPYKIKADKQLYINHNAPNQNIRINIQNITHRIVDSLRALSQDLLEIASYVYYADCSIQRGTEFDVYGENWQRRFHFVIPVSNPELWNDKKINSMLCELLEFLTQDKISITFTPPKPNLSQLYFKFPDSPPQFPGASCICLFSGGLDSLVGSLLLKNDNKRPLLVSHRSMPKMDSQQQKLVDLLRQNNPDWVFPHISIWINRMANPAIEVTQRSRSFLFVSLAAILAFQLEINNIFICENGIVTINLPQSGQNVGSLLTRSTHPKVLFLFEELIKRLFNKDIKIENPFIFYTKTQMLKQLKDWSQSELIQTTISCSLTQGKTKMQPQCGTCPQCIGRRFAIIGAGLEQHDRAELYEKDVFLHSLEVGKETAYAEGFVRSALEMHKLNDMQFFSKYPQLNEILNTLQISPDECAKKIYELYQNHANEVINVTTQKCREYQKDLIAGELPETCLISMLNSRHHLLNPLDEYANKIALILRSALRLIFQTRKPNNERELQDGTEAVLSAAGERLKRESPSLSYSIVRTTPDFSKMQNASQFLFIEMKFLDNRAKLNRIITDITSRITIYRDQGALVLFVIYDTNDFIKNDDVFVADLERHDGIKAIVIR